MPTWEAQVLARIERFKRYPRRAQLRQQQGTAHVRFTVGRRGDVLAFSLQRSSGIEALDEETLALIERAKPFPAPPAEIGRDTVELVVPVRYYLR
jgi:protein TonB